MSAVIDLADLHSYDDRVAIALNDSYLVKNLWNHGAQYEKQGRELNSGPLARHDVAVFRVKPTAQVR